MKKIAILRGINVSGQKKIKMAELKDLIEQEGLMNVQTYIQSGNLLFDFMGTELEAKTLIESAIQNHYAFEVPTIVFSGEFLADVIQKNQFKAEAEELPKQTIVTFFSEEVGSEKLKSLPTDFPNEYIALSPTHAYVHTPNGYGKAKLNNNFIEKKLAVNCTTRNWTTIEKLYQLTQS